MGKYNYSRTLKTVVGNETFSVEQFDSFDEAIKAVDKGIRDRKLFLKAKEEKKEYTDKDDSGAEKKTFGNIFGSPSRV